MQNEGSNLSLIVVPASGLALIGVQWIHFLQLTLNKIVVDFSRHGCSIHPVCTSKLWPLGARHGSRPLPFAFLDGVKEEFDRQVHLGILDKIDTSPRETPLVSIRKMSGSIRICEDFEVTINAETCISQHPYFYSRRVTYEHSKWSNVSEEFLTATFPLMTPSSPVLRLRSWKRLFEKSRHNRGEREEEKLEREITLVGRL